MKKLTAAVIVFLTIFTCASAVADQPQELSSDFFHLFDRHGAIILIIDWETGDILYANGAAAEFYGYSETQLASMNVASIARLPVEEINLRFHQASAAQKNLCLFDHYLATGQLRTVEVFFYPASYAGRSARFSIVHDVTEKLQLERERRTMTIAVLAGSGVAILCLGAFVVLLLRGRKKLENTNTLRKIFFDASDALIYLKDEQLRYVFANQAMAAALGVPVDRLAGKDDLSLPEDAAAHSRRQAELAVLESAAPAAEETEWRGRLYHAKRFPVKMPNGQLGVGAYITDITERREHEKKQEKLLLRHKILTDVILRGFESRHAQLDYVLHEALGLTESKYGYIYLYDEKTQELTLNSWTAGVMEACAVAKKYTVYQLDNTGLWGEVVRQRRPIVVNDFEAPNPLKKGYPEGHVALKRFLSVPVIIDEKIVAVVGLANKQSDYDESDVYEITMLMNGTWNAMERKHAQDRLALERKKYLRTILSIGDGVMVVDRNGKIEMLNHIAERLTGWSFADARGRHYREVFVLTHEQEGAEIGDPIGAVLATGAVEDLENHAVLLSKNGERYLLEDSAAPIKDETNSTVGVVLVFRDVTEKKRQQQKIEYLSFRDPLTGLYNRRFFEEELLRLDTERNLPISVIMADVNGLKLTNDIFGHASGDLLLQKISEVLRKACRSDDIIARWGGDEFVILLPKTSPEKAEQIIARVKTEFSKEQVKAIRGSVSMGADTKRFPADNIFECLSRAEEKMYAIKTLERGDLKSGAVDAIMDMLHASIAAEQAHAETVSALCEKLARQLHLPEGEVRRLRRAGFLHDIGKIVLDPKIAGANPAGLTDAARSEYRKHPAIGYRILNLFDDTLDLSEVVLAHHERWDGAGYPQGLREDEIPLAARILAVADAYERALHREGGRTAALQTVREGAGSCFDPKVAACFIRLLQSDAR